MLGGDICEIHIRNKVSRTSTSNEKRDHLGGVNNKLELGNRMKHARNDHDDRDGPGANLHIPSE